MSGRLASGVLVSALIRLAQQEGGHAMLLHKGEAEAGAISIEIRENGRFSGFFDRIWSAEGCYRWQALPLPTDVTEMDLAELRTRRLRYDSDLWLLELDIANVQRFIAQMPVGA
jgi:hypothetical protein